ncbi:hypothetical protein KSS87_018206 [Heliosperma pusillum]|nr:hypothetical protein KSS87_018206 [Heliosperma pusillum]
MKIDQPVLKCIAINHGMTSEVKPQQPKLRSSIISRIRNPYLYIDLSRRLMAYQILRAILLNGKVGILGISLHLHLFLCSRFYLKSDLGFSDPLEMEDTQQKQSWSTTKFYFAPAPGKMGYLAAVSRFLKVMAMVWAGSQVTKLFRAAGALALAPIVDRGLSWFTVKFKFESRAKAFITIVGFCFGLAVILFVIVTLLSA